MAGLKIEYQRPVPTGDVVLVRVWFERFQGSKVVVQAVIEDSGGRTLAEGRGTLVGLRPDKSNAFPFSPKANI